MDRSGQSTSNYNWDILTRASNAIIFALFVLALLMPPQAANGREETPLAEGMSELKSLSTEDSCTNLIETSHDDSDWVLVVSDLILREDLYYTPWYDRILSPCYEDNRYWELPPNEVTGEAFPIEIIGEGTSDGLYVKAGYYFQLFSNIKKPESPFDLIPYGPLMMGPKYVSVDCWQNTAPDGFEPDTFFVEGGPGGLKDYSIIIYTYDPAMLIKTSDVPDGNCISIDDPIEYTIAWHNTMQQTIYDACIRDVFPAGVTYPVDYTIDPNTLEIICSDPFYQPDHTYVFPIESLSPNDSGVLQLDVIVNGSAQPGGYLHNAAELWGTVYVLDPNDPNSLVPAVRLIARATVDMRVCCYITPPQILFVDETATNGAQTGVDWANAFLSLQDALAFARSALCGEVEAIYCAQGVYSPAGSEDDGFDLRELPGISLFGGFRPGGCDFSERSPKRYETILTGLIDEDEFPDAITVVTMGDETVLDGFTVMNGFSYNIYGSGVDFTITHCTVRECFFGYGIHADNGDVSVQWTTVNSNGTDGLYHEGEGYSLTVDNSWLLRNGEHGIRCESSTPTIRNSIVSENDLMRWGRQGIRLYRPTYQPRLYNLTVANNKAQAIYFEDDGDATGNPNNLDYPDLQNSILFFNGGGSQIAGFDPDLYANFCCIQDCNTIGTTNFNDEPGFAYQADPNGTPDPNNYHLAANSICIDRANPFLDYTAQVDIDGEGLDRKYGDFVDVGADEVYDCFDDYLSDADVRNDVDFDADGLVNLAEFSTFSRAWLSRSPYEFGDPNLADPNAIANWNPKCNLADTGSSQYVIDLADLAAFLEDWLWIACWRTDIWQLISQQQFIQVVPESMMVAGLQPAGTMSQAEPSVAEQTTQLISIIVALEQLWLDPE
ncbi:MAG TPA: right-handed parallel beta-helix repeat-containing protein, partial [Anaerohalosphaeraceae bacterium]|nr:right-handed parallel beta-helix repeat-containing protein [Anaerohalosphaeraceae bacterium]